jgi:ribose transport system ATP-binding protein
VEASIGVARSPAAIVPALRLWDLSKTFGGQKALDKASLEIAPGEVHGLLGQNGCGKSTLIKILAGFHAPDPGSRLEMDGAEVPLPLAPGEFRKHRMSFVHQHLGLIPSLTALENLLLGRLAEREAWAINWSAERRAARAVFASYDIDLDPGARVADIAPVERALLAIVRAVTEMNEAGGVGAGLLVLDEPTPFLPKRDIDRLFHLVRAVIAKGASVIFVSHDVDEVMEITDRATVLRDGKVAAAIDTRDATKADFIEAIVGRKLGTMAPPTPPAARGPSHAVVHNLSGGTIEGFSLDLVAGEVVGVTGLIGSGYDEIPYLIYGAREARGGTLDIGGRGVDLSRIKPGDAIRHGVVLVPADRANAGVIGTLPVADNVTMPILASRFRHWMLRRRAMTAEAAEMGHHFEVRPADPTMTMSSLSGGNQQKVVLAKWFQMAPKLILLDEPTQGVDIGARQTVFRHIANAASAGAAVLCASSDYEQLAAICSRVLIFAAGRVIGILDGAEINKEAIAERSLAGAGSFA